MTTPAERRDGYRDWRSTLEGAALVEAENHAPDEKRGGCICGFCAYSVDHVVVMALREALDRNYPRALLAASPAQATDCESCAALRADDKTENPAAAPQADTAATDDLEGRVACVLRISPEDHATRSRDYGRGFAECLRVVQSLLNPGPGSASPAPPEGQGADSAAPKSWQIMALAQRLWEQHGHPGEVCEPGSTGIGSCALREAAGSASTAPVSPEPGPCPEIYCPQRHDKAGFHVPPAEADTPPCAGGCDQGVQYADDGSNGHRACPVCAPDDLDVLEADTEFTEALTTVLRDGSVISPEVQRRVRELLDQGKPTTVKDTAPMAEADTPRPDPRPTESGHCCFAGCDRVTCRCGQRRCTRDLHVCPPREASR